MVYRPLYPSSGSSPDASQYKLAAWATYTPTWTSSGTQPSLGNGTLVGGYRREGTTLHVRGQLIVGSTSTVGTGDFRMALPSGMVAVAAQHQSMAAFWFSGGVLHHRVAAAEPSTSYVTFGDSVNGRVPTSGLSNGDYMNFTGTIEIVP